MIVVRKRVKYESDQRRSYIENIEKRYRYPYHTYIHCICDHSLACTDSDTSIKKWRVKQTLENTEEAITNGQSRETGNIYMTKKNNAKIQHNTVTPALKDTSI